MKIYTKTGDGGETSLHGGGRVAKDVLRIDAYGTVDELNSHVGLALAHDAKQRLLARLRDDVALDEALDVEVSTKMDIPDDYRIVGYQGGASRDTCRFLTSQH